MTFVKPPALLLAIALSPIAVAQSDSTDGDDLVISTNGSLSVATADGDYSIKIGGRIQYDYNRAEENDVVDEDAFDIRRARLYVSGDVMDWGYKAQFNIGNNNGGTPEDLYIRYNGLSSGIRITIGRQKEAFGLEQLTSSKDNSLLERAAASEAYTPGRSDGIQIDGSSGNLFYALGVFEDEFTGVGDSEFSVTGRVATPVVQSDDLLVHLGLAHTSRGGDVSSTGFEAALVSGSLHLQSEYFASESAGTDLDGYYVQAGWILTGESRPYSKGVFGRVSPSRPSGAWEVVVRYEGGDGNYSDIELGNTEASAWGLGLNWYTNSLTRFGLNYTSGDDEATNDSGSELRARVQFAF